MKRIIPTFLASLLLVVACGQTNSSESKKKDNNTVKKEEVEVIFRPDSSINNCIFLHSPSSTLETLGDIMPLLDANKDLPDAYFKTQSEETEYLRVVFFPGNELNSISQFEIGYSSNLSDTLNLNSADFSSFQTESGIKLGMTRQELVSIKGNEFREEKVEGQTLLTFSIDDSSSSFLSRYNMPLYIAEYWLMDGKITKYRFGFEYP